MHKHKQVIHHRTDQQLFCHKCGNSDRKYVQLQCRHIFCIICATFMYIKTKKSLSSNNQSSIRCSKCDFISQLDQVFIDLIKKTLFSQVIPNLDATETFSTQNKIAYKNMEKSHFIHQTIDRKIKSQQHSFQNITPSTAKYFFSKCQSPSSRKKRDSRRYCKNHTMDQIAYLCLTCDGQMLCVKCISSSKKHMTHQVKDLSKAIQIIKQQLNYTKLDIFAKIDNLQMCQRRIDDSSGIVRTKGLKTINDIKFRFNELIKTIRQKQNEIIRAYESHFQSLQRNLNIQDQKIGYKIQLLKNHIENMNKIQTQKDNFQFLTKYKNFKKTNQKILLNDSPSISLQKLAQPQSSITRQIAQLSQKITSLKIQYKQTKPINLQNCRSQSKMRKDKSYKRVRTNLGSLNSSRDKKQKKYTKTQQDQKRIKHQKIVNYRNEKRNSGKMPAYINDFINKKGNKCGSGASSYVLQMTSGNMQSSKMGSKMSKTIVPDQARRKKQHVAVIKQRIQRKTVHPNFRSQKTGQSNKKKRNHKD